MFYSHEVLTSRKYGFATVWLVATMGSGSKKVSRKAILDVDVSKTCDTIAEPSVPLALRLQSSLLYGVVKVYNQQCTYVLNDAESTRNQMRQLFKSIQSSGLNLEGANKGRNDNLILGDDPAFLPELDFGLIDLDASFGVEQYSNLAVTNSILQSTPLSAGQLSARLSFGDELLVGTLRRPTSASRLSDVLGITTGKRPVVQDEGLQDDLGIDFDIDGDVRMHESPLQHNLAPAVPSDVVAYGDFMQLDDEPLIVEQLETPVKDREDLDLAQLPQDVVETTEAAPVELRQQRKRVLPLDSSIELRSHVLKAFQDDYVDNMNHDAQRKSAASNQIISRENALHWFLDNLQGHADQLNIFRGWDLINAVTDLDLNTPRPVRPSIPPRTTPARASLPPILEDDLGYVPDYNEIEYGREQPTPLDDHRQSTMLPWNLSSDRRAGSQAAMSLPFGSRSRLPSLQPRSQLSVGGDMPNDYTTAADPVDHAQPATESQWLRSALQDESINFLTFVQEVVQQRETRDVAFSALLPTLEHTVVTAAQALLHVLTLGTKNKLAAVQDEVFGDIMISVL